MGKPIYNIPEVCSFFNAKFLEAFESGLQKFIARIIREEDIKEGIRTDSSEIKRFAKEEIRGEHGEKYLKTILGEHKRLLGYYNDVFVMGERPSIYDLYGLGALSLRYQLLDELEPELAAFLRGKGTPSLKVVSTEELRAEHFQYTTVLIGSPYTNKLVRALTTEGDSSSEKLDFKLDLPFKFRISESRKVIDILDEEDLSIIGELKAVLQKHVQKLEKYGYAEEHSRELFRELPEKEISESVCELVPQKEKVRPYQPMFIPSGDAGTDKGWWNSDYFMIVKLPSLRQGYDEGGRGKETFILAGCHGLGTSAACMALYNPEILDKLGSTREYFQAWGEVYKGGGGRIKHIETLPIELS